MPKTVEPNVDFHQFTIGVQLEPIGSGPLIVPPLALLRFVTPTSAAVLTGVASGTVRLTCVALDEAPVGVDPGWEDVSEVSLRTTDTPLVAAVWDVGDDAEVADRLDGHGAGMYRLRVHARGRDIDVDGVAFEPFEDYLIFGWPAAYQPPETLRADSRIGRSEVTPRPS
ncbi:hypothetical protein [Cellulomonas sp. P5_C5]